MSGRSRKIILITVPVSVLGLLVTGFIAYKLLHHAPPIDVAQQTFKSLSSVVDEPLYTTNKSTTYRFDGASAEDGELVISSYVSDEGTINVTQQPKPASDPFGTVKPVSTFVSQAGEGRLFPDNDQNPYIIVTTPLSWIIVRSNSEKISSDDLKDFCLTLQKVEVD